MDAQSECGSTTQNRNHRAISGANTPSVVAQGSGSGNNDLLSGSTLLRRLQTSLPGSVVLNGLERQRSGVLPSVQADLESMKKGELLAVDPGKKHAGAAFFHDGRLIDCTLIRSDDPLGVAYRIEEWLWGQPSYYASSRCPRKLHEDGTSSSVHTLVTERQQIYPGIRSADPNDLLPLAECVGAVNALIYSDNRIRPLPREWKGSTPKAIFTNRIEGGMSLSELALLTSKKIPKSLIHNVVDAIGLGKWAIFGRAY